MSGKLVSTVPGDFMLMDAESVISSILRGPDQRTAITERTNRVLYTVYAPFGVEEQLVIRHLSNLEEYIRRLSDGTAVCFRAVI